MIDRREVLDLAREFGLAPQVVEKDYVLGWMLAGIGSHAVIGSKWIFKGGTCLKKCYFETYRFSEDLDFTLTDRTHLEEGFLKGTFLEIAAWIYEQAGIEVPADLIRFDLFENPRGKVSAQGRIAYRGPLMPRGDLPRMKLDLTDDEVVVLDPEYREVHHPFSDKPADGIWVNCYPFEEVFAEKVRALAERARPRDLYDVIHLFRHEELKPEQAVIFRVLGRKCEFKGIPIPTMEYIENHEARPELNAEWANMLGHQLPALPLLEKFWGELPALFAWLHGGRPKEPMPTISVPRARGIAIDETWRPPAMVHAWNETVPLEKIRFAAANRLCVDLAYQGSTRPIEPYSLRRTRDGNLLLMAVKHKTGEPRSYRVDRIQGADISQESFTPRYTIELTPAGPISALPYRPQPESRNQGEG